jgi:hypothetical protein
MGSENAHRGAQNTDNGFGFDFLEHSHKDDNEFLSHTVQETGDETWVSSVNVETKKQSKQWKHTYSPNKLKKLNKHLPARKLMATVFWDRKGVLVVDGIHATRDYNNITSVLRVKR